MLKRAHYWALGIVTVLTLLLLNLPPTAAGRLKLAVSGVFLPLFGLAGSGQSFVDRASYALLTRRTLISELERLQTENGQLRLAATQGQDALTENARLRGLLGWQPKTPWKRRPAHVVGREPSTWWRSVTIDFGARDGALVNLPIITNDGLVGRIRAVGPTHSEVALIGDPECGVSAIVAETRDNGIIQEARSSAVGDGYITFRTLQNSPAIMTGQQVLTSGLGGVFPKGIPIGAIADSRTVEGGLYTEARLRLAANLNRLEEVWVLTP